MFKSLKRIFCKHKFSNRTNTLFSEIKTILVTEKCIKCKKERNEIIRLCYCKYSEHCRVLRQNLQNKIREDKVYEKIEDCDFYKLIEEDNREE